MTPGQRRWLERLKAEGTAVRPRYGSFPMAQCVRLGWTAGFWRDAATKEELTVAEVIERKWVGVELGERITEAGLAALDG